MEISICSSLLDTDLKDWTASNNDKLSVMHGIFSGEVLGLMHASVSFENYIAVSLLSTSEGVSAARVDLTTPLSLVELQVRGQDLFNESQRKTT